MVIQHGCPHHVGLAGVVWQAPELRRSVWDVVAVIRLVYHHNLCAQRCVLAPGVQVDGLEGISTVWVVPVREYLVLPRRRRRKALLDKRSLPFECIPVHIASSLGGNRRGARRLRPSNEGLAAEGLNAKRPFRSHEGLRHSAAGGSCRTPMPTGRHEHDDSFEDDCRPLQRHAGQQQSWPAAQAEAKAG